MAKKQAPYHRFYSVNNMRVRVFTYTAEVVQQSKGHTYIVPSGDLKPYWNDMEKFFGRFVKLSDLKVLNLRDPKVQLGTLKEITERPRKVWKMVEAEEILLTTHVEGGQTEAENKETETTEKKPKKVLSLVDLELSKNSNKVFEATRGNYAHGLQDGDTVIVSVVSSRSGLVIFFSPANRQHTGFLPGSKTPGNRPGVQTKPVKRDQSENQNPVETIAVTES